MLSSYAKKTILLGILVCMGLGLRCYCIDANIPEGVYNDSFKFVRAAKEMVVTGNFTPQYFQYPTFYRNLLAVIYWLTDISSVYSCYVTARLVSALFGCALIIVTYVVASELCSFWGSILAATLMTFSLTCITSSRLPVPDCILTLFMTLTIWGVTRYQDFHWRHFWLIGIFTGLAMGTKFTGLYVGGFVFLCYVVFLVAHKKTSYIKGFLGSIIIALLVLFLTTPWIVTFFAKYYNRLLLEMAIQKHGTIGYVQYGYFDYLISPTITWGFPWLKSSLLYNLGLPVTLLGVLGVLWALSKRYGAIAFLYACYITLYLILISGPGRLKAIRFVLPILPFFFVLCSWFCEKILLCKVKKYKPLMIAALFVLCLAVPVSKSLQYVAIYGRQTTQQQVFEWAKRNIPAGSTVFLCPFSMNHLRNLPIKTFSIKKVATRQYRIPNDINYNTELRPIYHPGLIDTFYQLGVDYVILTSYSHDTFSAIPENLRWFPKSTAAYARFKAYLQKVATDFHEIIGYAQGKLGPDIEIYRFPSKN